MFTSDRRFRRSWAAAIGLALIVPALAGCGVKSKPELPDESSYPRTYPAGADAVPTGVPGTTQTAPRAVTQPTRTSDDGTYTPPPAATDPQFLKRR